MAKEKWEWFAYTCPHILLSDPRSCPLAKFSTLKLFLLLVGREGQIDAPFEGPETKEGLK